MANKNFSRIWIVQYAHGYLVKVDDKSLVHSTFLEAVTRIAAKFGVIEPGERLEIKTSTGKVIN